MVWRDDVIVIQEFTIYATGAIFPDGTIVVNSEKLADAYLRENWYDRYGEKNIKYSGDEKEDFRQLKEKYYYVEIHEMGFRDNSDLSRRCFTARWTTLYKNKKELDLD